MKSEEALVRFVSAQRKKFAPNDWIVDGTIPPLERSTAAEFLALTTFGHERPAPAWAGRQQDLLDIAKTLDRNGLDFQQRMKATGFDPSAFAKNVDDAFERDEIIRDLCQVFLVKKKRLEELGLTGDFPALEKFFQIPSGWLTDPAKFPDARQAIANHREWLKGVGRKMAENG